MYGLRVDMEEVPTQVHRKKLSCFDFDTFTLQLYQSKANYLKENFQKYFTPTWAHTSKTHIFHI